jgi:hypothetical protein
MDLDAGGRLTFARAMSARREEDLKIDACESCASLPRDCARVGHPLPGRATAEPPIWRRVQQSGNR